jgi:FkbM family methyltransferase
MTFTPSRLSISEIRELASKLAWVRPLAPYPGWYFDCAWADETFDGQLRRAIWTYFRSAGDREPLIIDWYHGLKLCLYLGNDQSRQLFIGGCTEPNELYALSRLLQPGMVCIDIGANEGLFSLLAASVVGATGLVWAFEPSPREFNRLMQNLEVNGLTEGTRSSGSAFAAVRPFQIALSHRAGSADLLVAEDEHAGHNTLGRFAHQTALLRTERVALQRLDDLVAEEQLSRIDLLKIDVEGAETAVLEGAHDVLCQRRPLILMEVLDAALRFQGSSRDELLQRVAAYDYRVHPFDPASGLPSRDDSTPISDNVLLIPREANLDELYQRLSGAPPSAAPAAA